jgi:hypothetical protein
MKMTKQDRAEACERLTYEINSWAEMAYNYASNADLADNLKYAQSLRISKPHLYHFIQHELTDRFANVAQRFSKLFKLPNK